MKEQPLVYLYDSTLRDGAQTLDVDFSVDDKRHIESLFDSFGIDFVEGGWPGSNPTDDAFFATPARSTTSKRIAFGMTRKKNVRAEQDPQLQRLKACSADGFCIVGKCWDFHAQHALGVSLEENLRIIADSVAYLKQDNGFVLFDGEHFFDGYRNARDYALRCLDQAQQAGADWLILCDTNGGTLPEDIERVTQDVVQRFGGERIGIHCHNDIDMATACSLAAVRAGARQIQGTFNGLGERCGNANLVSILPTLVYKMGYRTTLHDDALRRLTSISHSIDEIINRPPESHAPFVGRRAFAHKGGLHASAVAKNPTSYEHIDPALIGNQRALLVSNQAGRASIRHRLSLCGIENVTPAHLDAIIAEVKAREYQGYAYDAADASFQLLARTIIDPQPAPFTVHDYLVTSSAAQDAHARVVIDYQGKRMDNEANGNGPVNALDKALRGLLTPLFPSLKELALMDYKVRIMAQHRDTAAKTRVIIDYVDANKQEWATVGVSHNVVAASWQALMDGILWALRT
ncbi:MAG: citramalate synthase [Alphaproteobacteria bacterium GM202ARS2]|nr:citramalate synthase [Alphaproteobacteria bacterium GM202ARS2]